MFKNILGQALAFAIVTAINEFVSKWINTSLLWGVVAAWILIDDVGMYQDYKILLSKYNDLYVRHHKLEYDYKKSLREKNNMIDCMMRYSKMYMKIDDYTTFRDFSSKSCVF
jgi:hypothetical protein